MIIAILKIKFKLTSYQKYIQLPVLLLIMLCTCISFGQDEIEFHAFGRTPSVIKDSLYKILYDSKNQKEISNTLFTIAREHLTFGDGDSVVHYAHLLKNVNLNQNNKSIDLIRHHLLLGNGKFLNGFYNSALKAYIEGLDLSNELKKETLKAWLKLGMGQVYTSKKEFSKAKEVLSPLLKQKNDTIAAKAYFYLADISLNEDRYEETTVLLQKASELIIEKELQKFKLLIQLRLADLDFKKEEYNDALSNYEYVIPIALKNNYFDIYTEAILGYGKIFDILKDYEVAEMTLSMAYANSIQWNRLELQKKIINSLRFIYQKKGDYTNAYNLMTQYVSVSNQIIQQQNNRAIKELEIKYQTLQKENEIFELKEAQLAKQAELERQKTIKKAFLYGFLVLLIPIIALLFVYYQKLQAQSQLNHQQEELNAQKIATLLSTQELELARTSLDAQQEERHRIAKQLHDSIGGNLAGIKLQISNLKGNAIFHKDVMTQVNETYELVRDISHNLIPKKFNQKAFTFLLESYIDQLKNNSDIQIAFSAHPKQKINNLPEKLKVELYQIIQELLTNTLKHANAKNVEIHLNIHETMFQLIFEDDGNGFEVEKFRKGIGLQNIESRLQLLNANLILDSAPKRGTVITIEIPLKD